MLSILGWIPVIGPILQGLFGMVGKILDSKVALHQTDATRDVEEAKVSAQIIHDTNDDICLRLLRDIYCTPACIHLLLVSWDTYIAETKWISHTWMWHVASYPVSYAWYPTTVAVFLLGNIGLNIWNRK